MQFLLQKTALSSYSRENNAKEACRLFLSVAVPMYSLATNQLYAVFHHFPTEQSRLGYARLILQQKGFKYYTLS